MPLSPQSEKPPNGSGTIANAVVVRGQLRRLLAHPLFNNSKRYPVLLEYTVEQALQGNASDLKERTIGVEAFGREPEYDVNLDPVVRTTAAEVRKRLIQYYYNPEHAGELVIEMPVGSYIPTFREPASPQATTPTSLIADTEALRVSDKKARPHILGTWPWISVAAALLAVGLIGFGVGRYQPPKAPSNLERFWQPITATSSRITYCLGEPVASVNRNRVTPASSTRLYGGLDVADVVTLARSIVPLVPRSGAFRVLPSSEATYAQLREGPFVLIGAYDNPWAMRISQDMPFRFEYDEHQVRRIVDHKSTEKRFWALQWEVPNVKLARDYAIVARIHDSVTGQPVIILGGILAQGTEAAGEVVSNPDYFDALLQKAPKDWDQKNMAAVIETNVIEDHAGPPTVVAVETW